MRSARIASLHVLAARHVAVDLVGSTPNLKQLLDGQPAPSPTASAVSASVQAPSTG